MRKLKKYELMVNEVKGKCFYNYEAGQTIAAFTGMKTPEGMCGAAYHAIFPSLFTLNFNGRFEDNGQMLAENVVACPDGGNIVLKLKIVGEEEIEI